MTLARGLQRKKLDRGMYYVINLAELTRGTILGESLEYWTDAEKRIPRTQEAWTWDALARWLLCMEGTSLILEAPERDAIIAMFRDEPLNAPNLPYLYDAWVPSHVPTASDEDDKEPIASKEPMILVFREENLPRAGFQYWYRRRVLFGTGSNLPGATSKEFSYLDDFRKKYLVPLEVANGLVEGQIVKPLAKLTAQLHIGEVLFTALQDFAGSVQHRRDRWRRDGKADPRAESVYVVPPPTEARMAYVRGRSAEWTALSESLIEITRWEVCYGKEAKVRDARAKALLARLRDAHEPALQMLAHLDLLTPHDHLKLRTLLADCFAALTKSPWACEKLMRGEFAAVAQAASAAPVEVPFEPSSDRERSIALVLKNFDAKKTFPIEEETPLTDVILKLFKSAKENMADWKEKLSNVSIGLDLLGLATPFVQRELFVPGSGVIDVGWGWRALIGSARIDEVNARWVWAELRRTVSGKAPAPGFASEPLLDSERGALAKGLDGLSGNVAWKTAKVLLTTILAAEATAELSAETPEKAMAGLSTIMSEAKALADLVTLDPEKCFILSRTTVDAASTAKLTGAIEKTPAIELLGPLADALAFVGSALEYRAATRGKSREMRELASYKATIDALSLAVGLAGMATGLPLVAASVALLLASNVILNPRAWDVVVPELSSTPSPQLFLKGILQSIEGDDLITRLREDSELGPAKGGVSMADFDNRIARLLDALETPSSTDPGMRGFWDIGGMPGASVQYVNFSAMDILHEYYGFDDDATKKIVAKSKEVEVQ